MQQNGFPPAYSAAPPGKIADAERAVAQYQGKSEAELLAMLRGMMAAERAAGRLDDARYQMMTNWVLSMLGPAERARVEVVLKEL